MKERNRLFAILLSVVMAISYMPALAFAEAEGDVPVDAATVEESLDVQPEAEAVEEQPAEEPEAVAPETAEPEAVEAEEVEEALVSTPEDPAAALEPAPEETLETPAQEFGKTDAEIVSVRFVAHDGAPITLTEGINGYYDAGFFRYSLSYGRAFDFSDVIIVDYSDGSSVTYKSMGSGQFYNQNDYMDFIMLNGGIFNEKDSGQSAENPWKAGDTHVITYTYSEDETISFTINVKIAANPVESIYFVTSEGKGTKGNPIELIEGVDGYEGTIYGPDGPTPHFYYSYSFKNGDVLTVNYSDGKSESYFYSRYQFVDENGAPLDSSQTFPSLSLAQGSDTWTLGNDYEGTVSFSGRTTPVYVTIVESPVSSIEYRNADGRGAEDNPIELIEGIDNDDATSYYYSNREGDVLTVNYKDSTSETYYYSKGSREFLTENGKSLGSDIYFDCTEMNDCVVGETYSAKFSYLGVTGVAYFTLIENPVESVEYRSADGSGSEDKPIKLVEGVDGTYQTDESENEYFRYKTRHKAGNTITVKYKDPNRESVVYTYEGDGFYDKDHKRLNGNDYYFEQNYDQYEEHWKIGQKYSDIFYCLGVETTVYFAPAENPVKKVEFARNGGVKLQEGRDAVNSDGGDGTFFLEYPLEYKEGDILKVTRQNEGETSPSEVTYIAVSNPDTDIWYEEIKFVKAVNGNPSELDNNDVIYVYDLDWDSDEQTPDNEWKAGETNHWFTVTYNGVTSDQIPVTMLENPVKSFSFSRDGGVVLYEGVDGVNSDGADGQFFEYYLEFKPGDKLHVNTSDDYARVYEAVRNDSSGDISFVSKSDPEDVIYEDDIAVKPDSDQYDVHWTPNDGVNHKFILSFSGSTCEVPVTLKEKPAHSHTLEPAASKAATCTEPGNSAYWYCSGCGKYFSDAEGKTEITENSWVIAALGHDYQFSKMEWSKTNDGYTAKALYVCSHDAGHTTSYDASVTSAITPATCDKDGQVVYTASYDGHTETKTDTITKLGHAYGPWESDGDSQHKRVCANDPSHVETGAHEWDAGTDSWPDGEDAPGVRTYTCTVCGGTKTEPLKSKLEEAKDAAHAELDKVNVNDYSGTEKANVEAALAKGRADIASAQTVDAVNAAKTAALNTIKAQKTDAQKNAEAVVPAAPAAPPAPTEIIDLPTVKISKPAAAKKKITVKWKKVSKKNLKKISGIQIQVATDPDFTNIVKTATAGKKKTSKAIKGLQPKTKYYVRIRAYAPGDHYSVWKSKSAKVK